MFCIINRYFTFQRILLLVVGLWPYQQSKLVQLQLNLCSGFQISFIIFQLSVFITAECTLDFVIKVLSFVLLLTTYAIEYNSFRINAQAVKYSLEQLQLIYNELTDENEIAIIKKYGNNAKRLTITIIILYICGSIIVGSITILPYILNLVLHINVTQPRVMKQLMPEYFTEQESHFYLILLYMDIVLFIGATTLVGSETIFVSYFIQTCGIFKIASYRIEKAITIKMPINIDLEKRLDQANEIIIYKKIIRAVDIHCKAIKLSFYLMRTIQGSHILMIIINVVCLSLNLYAIAVNISNEDDVQQLLMHFLIMLVVLLYLFFINYIGQEIMNHNDHVFFTVYNVQWYIAPLRVQKLILFLLLKGSKTVSLNYGGVVLLSLKFFATLTKASLSYFTVMYSIQE
ncbi:hypothetical protein ACFW04_007916 [Cataglyphis niger]